MYLLYGCHIQKIRYLFLSFTSFDQATLILIYKTPNSEARKSTRFSSFGKNLGHFCSLEVVFANGHRPSTVPLTVGNF
jgi:hypothetical protein